MSRPTKPKKTKKLATVVTRRKVTKRKTRTVAKPKSTTIGLKKTKTKPRPKKVVPRKPSVKSKKKKTILSKPKPKPRVRRRPKKKKAGPPPLPPLPTGSHIKKPTGYNMIIGAKTDKWMCLETVCNLEEHNFAESFPGQIELLTEHWREVHGARLDMKTLKCIMIFDGHKVILTNTFQHWFEVGRKRITDFPNYVGEYWGPPFAITGNYIVCLEADCPLKQEIHYEIGNFVGECYTTIKDHILSYHPVTYNRVHFMVKIRGESFWSTVAESKVQDWIRYHRKTWSFEDFMYRLNGGLMPGEQKRFPTQMMGSVLEF